MKLEAAQKQSVAVDHVHEVFWTITWRARLCGKKQALLQPAYTEERFIDSSGSPSERPMAVLVTGKLCSIPQLRLLNGSTAAPILPSSTRHGLNQRASLKRLKGCQVLVTELANKKEKASERRP